MTTVEMNKEMENEELTEEELNEVNGGYIVDRGFWSRYWIVSDYTGNVSDTAFFKIDANAICETRTISDQVISKKSTTSGSTEKIRVCPAPSPMRTDAAIIAAFRWEMNFILVSD